MSNKIISNASAATDIRLLSAICCGPAAAQLRGNAVNSIAWHDTDGDSAISIPADLSNAKKSKQAHKVETC